jgi:TPR repeat protein
MNYLGLWYLRGENGLKKNKAMAVTWLKKAASLATEE